MDNLTPPLLRAVREIRWSLRSGSSAKTAFQLYLDRGDDELTRQLRHRWALFQQGAEPTREAPQVKNRLYLETLWSLLVRGTQGEPILEPLTSLEDELDSAARMDLDDHLTTLPFKALVPLLFFHFPAFAITLLGPWLRELQRHLLLFALMAYGTSVRASSLGEWAAVRIAQAKSLTEINGIRKAAEDIDLNRRACAIELKEQRVPYRCFVSLKLESLWLGLSTSPSTFQRLNERCQQASFHFRGIDAGDMTVLSTACRSDVLRARRISAYKAEDHWREF